MTRQVAPAFNPFWSEAGTLGMLVRGQRGCWSSNQCAESTLILSSPPFVPLSSIRRRFASGCTASMRGKYNVWQTVSLKYVTVWYCMILYDARFMAFMDLCGPLWRIVTGNWGTAAADQARLIQNGGRGFLRRGQPTHASASQHDLQWLTHLPWNRWYLNGLVLGWILKPCLGFEFVKARWNNIKQD